MFTSLVIGLSIGFFGSFHCVAMCGPLMTFLHKNGGLTPATISHNSGRLVTYMAMGLVLGMIGEGIGLFGYQQALAVASGVLILLLVLLPKSQSHVLDRWSAPVIAKMKRTLSTTFQSGGLATSFTLGMLNGFLPCGLVYMALIASLGTASLADAALLMAGFGLGTSPALMAVLIGSRHIGRWRYQRIIPAISILIGILLILRGGNLDIPYISPALASIGWDAGIPVCK